MRPRNFFCKFTLRFYVRGCGCASSSTLSHQNYFHGVFHFLSLGITFFTIFPFRDPGVGKSCLIKRFCEKKVCVIILYSKFHSLLSSSRNIFRLSELILEWSLFLSIQKMSGFLNASIAHFRILPLGQLIWSSRWRTVSRNSKRIL